MAIIKCSDLNNNDSCLFFAEKCILLYSASTKSLVELFSANYNTKHVFSAKPFLLSLAVWQS